MSLSVAGGGRNTESLGVLQLVRIATSLPRINRRHLKHHHHHRASSSSRSIRRTACTSGRQSKQPQHLQRVTRLYLCCQYEAKTLLTLKFLLLSNPSVFCSFSARFVDGRLTNSRHLVQQYLPERDANLQHVNS